MSAEVPKDGNIIQTENDCLDKYENHIIIDEKSCPPVWDTLFCWPPTKAGTTISFPCDTIFPFLQQPSHQYSSLKGAVAYRICNDQGVWSRGQWTNYTECENLDIDIEDRHQISPITISYIILIISIISLASLLVTIFIFWFFRTLYCSRVRVHQNLVLSLILHAFMMIAISLPGISPAMEGLFRNEDWLCKGVLVLKMYAAMTCIHWMFVEGLLLHSSITVSVFQQEPPFKIYHAIGWGIPLICVVIWMTLMSIYSKRLCWKGYGLSPFVWIITGPMIIALLVNAVFLVNIIRILITKMRSNVAIETKQIKKAIKATALLFPLLGITHLLFCINPRTDLEQVYMLVNAVLQSSQGLFVAVLYCFLNSEVQSAVVAAYKRSTQRHNPRRSCRSSRKFGSSISTSLSPEHPHLFPQASKLRLALLQRPPVESLNPETEETAFNSDYKNVI
ncbi:corticotropin-releasing factor receptor 2 isoform X2 [Parasteatoda tepidariorum]|uniref:corticotropin-releasing factor receptor 2 isoform X2 n=1 Tax=Parasteatoda tepidariorum TaxID=114398 RepID=UPI00077F9B77|nr:corticotropin-releasing factor receptor 2 isoform X2 [Parasteatoda tepidariorum]